MSDSSDHESPLDKLRSSTTLKRARTGFGVGLITDCTYNTVRSRATLVVTFMIAALVALEIIANFLRAPLTNPTYDLQFGVAPPSSAKIGYPVQTFTARLYQGGEAVQGARLEARLMPYKPFPLTVTIGDSVTRLDEVDCLAVRAAASVGALRATQYLRSFCNVSNFTLNTRGDLTDANGVARFEKLLLQYGPSTAYALTVHAPDLGDNVVTPAFFVVDFTAPLQFEARGISLSNNEDSFTGFFSWQPQEDLGDDAASSNSNDNQLKQQQLNVRCIPISLDLLGPVRVAGVVQRRAACVHAEWRVDSFTTGPLNEEETLTGLRYSAPFQLDMTLTAVAETFFIGISCPGGIYFPKHKLSGGSGDSNFSAVSNYVLTPHKPIRLFISTPSSVVYERNVLTVTATATLHKEDMSMTPGSDLQLSCIAVPIILTSQQQDQQKSQPILPPPKQLLRAQFSIPLPNTTDGGQTFTGTVTHRFAFSITGGCGSYKIKCYGLSQQDYLDIEVRSNVSAANSTLTLLDPDRGVALEQPYKIETTVGAPWPVFARLHVLDSRGSPLTGKNVVIAGTAPVNYSSSLQTDIDGILALNRITSLRAGLHTMHFSVDDIVIGTVTVNASTPATTVSNPPCTVDVVDSEQNRANSAALYRGLPLNLSLQTLSPKGLPLSHSQVVIGTDAPAQLVCFSGPAHDYIACPSAVYSDADGNVNLARVSLSSDSSNNNKYISFGIGSTSNFSRTALHFTCVDSGGVTFATTSRFFDIGFVANSFAVEELSSEYATKHLRLRLFVQPSLPEWVKATIAGSNHVLQFVQRPLAAVAALGGTLPTVTWNTLTGNTTCTASSSNNKNSDYETSCIQQDFTMTFPTLIDGVYYFALSIDGIAIVMSSSSSSSSSNDNNNKNKASLSRAGGLPASIEFNNNRFYNLSLIMPANLTDYCSVNSYLPPDAPFFLQTPCVINVDGVAERIRSPLKHQPVFHVSSLEPGPNHGAPIAGATVGVAIKVIRSQKINVPSDRQILNSGYLTRPFTPSIDQNGTIIDPTQTRGVPLAVTDVNGTAAFSALTVLDGLQWCASSSNNSVWFAICALQSWSDVAVDGIECSDTRQNGIPFVYRYECPFQYNISIPKYASRAHLASEIPGAIVPGVPVNFEANIDCPATLAHVDCPDDSHLLVIPPSSTPLNSNSNNNNNDGSGGGGLAMTQLYTADQFHYFLINSTLSRFQLQFSTAADKGKHRVNFNSPAATSSVIVSTDSQPTQLLWQGTAESPTWRRPQFLGSTFKVAVRASIADVPTPNIAILARIQPDSDTCDYAGSGCGLLEGQQVSVTNSDGVASFLLGVRAATPGRFVLKFSATTSGTGLFSALTKRADDALSQLIGISPSSSTTTTSTSSSSDSAASAASALEATSTDHFSSLLQTLSSSAATSGAFRHFSTVLGPITSKFFLETTTAPFQVQSPIARVEALDDIDVSGVPPLSPSRPPRANVTDELGNPIPRVLVEIVFYPSGGLIATKTQAFTNDDGIAIFRDFTVTGESSVGTYHAYFDAMGTLSDTLPMTRLNNIKSKNSDNNTTRQQQQQQQAALRHRKRFIIVVEQEKLASLQAEMRNTALVAVCILIPIMLGNLPRASIFWIFVSIAMAISFLIAFIVMQVEDAENGSNQGWARLTFRVGRILLLGALLGSLLETAVRIFNSKSPTWLLEPPNERWIRTLGYARWISNYRRDPSFTDEDYREELNHKLRHTWQYKLQRKINKLLGSFARVEFVQLHRADEELKVPLPPTPPEIDPTYLPLKFYIALGVSTILMCGSVVICLNVTSQIRGALDRLVVLFPDSDSTSSSSSATTKTSDVAATVKTVVIELMQLAASVQPQLTFLTSWASALDSLDSFAILDWVSTTIRTIRRAFLTAEIVAHLCAFAVFVASCYFVQCSIKTMLVESRRGKHKPMRRGGSLAGADRLIGTQSLCFGFQHLLTFFVVLVVVTLLSVGAIWSWTWLNLIKPYLITFAVTLAQGYGIVLVAQHFLFDGITILNPFLYSIYSVYSAVIGVAEGLIATIHRFIFGLLFPVFFFNRIDWGILPKNVVDQDGAHLAFQSLVAVENAYTHPVFLVAAAELWIHSRLCAMQRVDDQQQQQQQPQYGATTRHDSATEQQKPLSPFDTVAAQASRLFGSVTVRGGVVDPEVFASSCSVPSLAALVELRVREMILDWKLKNNFPIHNNSFSAFSPIFHDININNSDSNNNNYNQASPSSAPTPHSAPTTASLRNSSSNSSANHNRTNSRNNNNNNNSQSSAFANPFASDLLCIADARRRRRVHRWWLFVILTLNPSLLAHRKHRLASCEGFSLSTETSTVVPSVQMKVNPVSSSTLSASRGASVAPTAAVSADTTAAPLLSPAHQT